MLDLDDHLGIRARSYIHPLTGTWTMSCLYQPALGRGTLSAVRLERTSTLGLYFVIAGRPGLMGRGMAAGTCGNGVKHTTSSKRSELQDQVRRQRCVNAR